MATEVVTVLRYISGVEVQAGDHVLYHGEAGSVGFVVPSGEAAWYIEQYGIGCMLEIPTFGSIYIRP
jgi:hypothetical protein